MTPVEIVRFMERHRWPLSDEKRLQGEVATALAGAGVAFERELRLGTEDVIDFLIGDVGMEVKIKGQRRAIYRQCERYCQHDRVRALVLATNAAMGMPAEINGRPIRLVQLGRAWL